jgi:general secretion pathway protein D
MIARYDRISYGLPLTLAALLGITSCAPNAQSPRAPATLLHALQTPATPPVLPVPAPAPVQTQAADSGPRTQYFIGTGETVGRAGPSLPDVQDGPGDITLNFVGADVREVVRSILGDILKQPYAIDQRVQGTVTLQTSRPVDREALLPILDNALRLNGLSLVRADGLYNVVPSGEATRFGAPIQRGAAPTALGQGYAIQIIPLRFASAEEIETLIKSVVPSGATLRSVPGRNLLIAAGGQREIASILELVGLFDVNALAGNSFALFYPRNADAKAMIKELETIFGVGKDRATGMIRFVAIERLNAILGVTRTASYLQEAAAWVERLDQRSATVDERIFVYYVQNGRAVDLAATLNSVFSRKAEAALANAGGSAPTRRIEKSDEPYLSQGLPIPLRPQAAQPALPGQLGAAPALREAPENAGTQVAFPPASDDGNGIRISAQAAPRIIADEKNNAILVMSTPAEYRIVEMALAKLDVPPLQVLIEAVVAEVTLTTDLRYGVQWFFRIGSNSFTLSNGNSSTVSPTFPGFAAVLQSGSDIRAVLSALESVTTVNVLSSPQLMVLNNQTATLQVGDQVPIATQSATSILTSGAPIVNTIQFRDTGVILKVTPRVNEGGLVLMDISQEVSDVARTTTSGIDSPTIQQRKFNSSVSVQNGETIALGGLIRDRRVSGDSGIPVLKDIPWLGNLFKTNNDSDNRTELVVLITPRVARSQADIRGITEEFRERLRALSVPAP